MQDYIIENGRFGLRSIVEQDIDFIYSTVIQTKQNDKLIPNDQCFDLEFVHNTKDVKTLISDIWRIDSNWQRLVVANLQTGAQIALCGIAVNHDGQVVHSEPEILGLTAEMSDDANAIRELIKLCC